MVGWKFCKWQILGTCTVTKKMQSQWLKTNTPLKWEMEVKMRAVMPPKPENDPKWWIHLSQHFIYRKLKSPPVFPPQPFSWGITQRMLSVCETKTGVSCVLLFMLGQSTGRSGCAEFTCCHTASLGACCSWGSTRCVFSAVEQRVAKGVGLLLQWVAESTFNLLRDRFGCCWVMTEKSLILGPCGTATLWETIVPFEWNVSRFTISSWRNPDCRQQLCVLWIRRGMGKELSWRNWEPS